MLVLYAIWYNLSSPVKIGIDPSTMPIRAVLSTQMLKNFCVPLCGLGLIWGWVETAFERF